MWVGELGVVWQAEARSSDAWNSGSSSPTATCPPSAPRSVRWKGGGAVEQVRRTAVVPEPLGVEAMDDADVIAVPSIIAASTT